MRPHVRAKRGAFAVAAAVAILVVSACQDAERAIAPSKQTPAADMRRAALSAAEVLAAAASPVCGGSGAHDRHGGFPTACATCHPCGGLLMFGDLVLPRGTSIAAGQINRGSPTSCTVACHYPFGAAPTPIAWDAPGPLACTNCHFQIGQGGVAYRSAHAIRDANPAVERSGCEACHALGAHLSGTVRIATGEGTSIDVLPNQPVDVACTNCHDGTGSALANQAPPILVGYAAANGDFHGDRAGSGYGGTLIGYQRGAARLPCKSCHDTHMSTNAFMFAANVNGAMVAPGVINRAGVGGEALCERCHAGVRHQGCVDCHGVDPMPAGSACFSCHGHEGIVNFVWPSPQHNFKNPDAGCAHCHSSWVPVLEYTPPAITNGLVSVTNVTGNSATISWTTDEKATSYVEYGIGSPGRVAGSNALTTQHTVTLTGLSEATTYVFRVRTSDAMRNVTLLPLSQLGTASLNAPPAPTLVDQAHVVQCDPLGSVVLRWNPVLDPQGDPVEYRVMLDDSPAFDSLRLDSGWVQATSFPVVVDLAYPPIDYYWRVQARDARNDVSSPWSATDHFYGLFDEWSCW